MPAPEQMLRGGCCFAGWYDKLLFSRLERKLRAYGPRAPEGRKKASPGGKLAQEMALRNHFL